MYPGSLSTTATTALSSRMVYGLPKEKNTVSVPILKLIYFCTCVMIASDSLILQESQSCFGIASFTCKV